MDRLSGELTAVEVDLPGADLSSVRGPSGWVLVGASLDSGRVVGGTAPDCALRRTSSGALAPAVISTVSRPVNDSSANSRTLSMR